jgi:RND family efflux transporter MFP subunit
MITLQFLVEWAVRSSILILGGALLLWALRVKAASIRLAAWTVMLCGSLAIPALTRALPGMPFAVMHATPAPMAPIAPHAQAVADQSVPPPAIAIEERRKPEPFDWPRAALAVYTLVAGGLLLRLGTGLVLSLRLRRASAATGRATEGIEIRESELLESPVALGLARPVILLPIDWRQWDTAKLDAVLAHERSHIGRFDQAVQALSAIHRALLWFSPLSWFLHQRLVRVAEEASDDAAIQWTCDRALYAKVLLDFIERGVRSASWQGVPMARYGRADRRIQRILDGDVLPQAVTRWSVAAILALGLPLAYLAAVARPMLAQAAAQESVPEAAQPVASPSEAPSADPAPAEPPAPAPSPRYLSGLGSVTATTVTVKSRVDGPLMSVSFKDGDLVQTGQLLATIDAEPYRLKLVQAEGRLAQIQAHLADKYREIKAAPKEERNSHMLGAIDLEGNVKIEQAKVDEARLQVNYCEIRSPINGVAGLRLVDPGNMVHAGDSPGLVVINQLQPIAVLFSISEDRLPQVLAQMKDGASATVEAWNRPFTARIATGRLTALDNQIDTTAGTVKLKAEFSNKDGALYPNQFVNVRLFLSK